MSRGSSFPFRRRRHEHIFAHDERSNMSQSDASLPLPVGPAPTSVPPSGFATIPLTDPPSGNGHESARRLRIAAPENGKVPGFENVYALAVTSALFDQSVLVICLTEELLTDWRRRLQERTRPLDGLTLVDGRFGWSANWRIFFQHRSYDVTVIHGIHAALKEENIPISYAKRLLGSIPSGLIVLA